VVGTVVLVGVRAMTKRLIYEESEDGTATQFADISNSLYDEAVNMAISDDMTVSEALKEVLTGEIESVEG